MKKQLISWFLLIAIVLSFTGCAPESTDPTLSTEVPKENALTMDLLSALERQPVESQAPDRELADPMGAFALALLQNSHVPGENTVLSPYSLYLSLAMTANGAQGRTLEQIEGLLGMAVGELNPYMLSFNCAQGSEVADANSLWLHKELPVAETYLQTLRNYFEAQTYTTPFDSETMDAMNQWIEEQTAGRITQAVDQMDPNAMMYLINALTFDGKWNTPYTTNDLTQQSFLAPSGERTVEMMGSEESYYLNCGRGTGFMKDYEGDRYSFFALLPNEGLALEDYLASLTHEELLEALEAPEVTAVLATMPKLKLDTTVEMKEILTSMGMTEAFTMNADFSGIEPTKSLYISRILHKTYLQVDEVGTQAGAATVTEFATKGVNLQQKTVFLNRPYVMGIYDKTNHCLLFLGTVSEP